ncbi:proteophosphoglycan ppg4 [Rhodotorula toruloides]|uniref:Proteophosphoglycan ppg4 n=1 Tax=Rhodotorula toruloides TaxID=5286 RepID=A0A511KQZ0_RHOTO|nr:proteophosphoglycan ppg4 [Rhodotorula toruloides]
MPPDMPAPSQTSPLASEETTSTPPPAPDPKQPLDTAGKAEALVSEATKAGKMDGQASEQPALRIICSLSRLASTSLSSAFSTFLSTTLPLPSSLLLPPSLVFRRLATIGVAASSSRRRSQIDTSGWTHPSSSSAAPTLAAHLTPLIIRDYAYPRTDPRFEGKQLPEDVEAERRFREEEALGRKRSSWDDEDEDGPVGGAVGPGFHWGFVTSHTSDFPAASDLSDNDSDTPDGYSFHDPEVDPSGHSNGDDELGDFVPGVYSAVYVFEPELDTEMRLEAGELVSVFERQCAGWVQAGRIVNNELTGEIGLVPENYLALVEAHEGVIDWTTGEDGDVHGTMHLQVTDGAQEAGKAGEAVEAKEGGAKENEAAANGAEPSQDPPTEPTHESSQ